MQSQSMQAKIRQVNLMLWSQAIYLGEPGGMLPLEICVFGLSKMARNSLKNAHMEKFINFID